MKPQVWPLPKSLLTMFSPTPVKAPVASGDSSDFAIGNTFGKNRPARLATDDQILPPTLAICAFDILMSAPVPFRAAF